MKRFFPYLILLLCLTATKIAGAQTQQYFNMTTGIVNGTSATLIPLLQNDDTWTVCQPGGNYLNPADYAPVPCALPYWNYPWPTLYTGATTSARWLTPYLNSAGYPTDNAPVGYYYYKMKFFLPEFCNLQSAHISLSHIGGDNEINQILVNNTDINIASPYGANSVVGPALEDITGYITPNAVNEIIVRVENYNLWSGMQIVGNLIVTADFLSPSFCLSTNNYGISGSSDNAGTHTWEVYSSPDGSPASFAYVGTYYNANLNVVDAGACYKVKHTVENECGTACEMQTICKKSCTETICTATAPTGLNLSGTVFSWNPVSGASSYELEIIPNDPNCCLGQGIAGPPIVIPTTGTSYNFNNYKGARMTCVRFRVKAFCANGAWAASEWLCRTMGSGGFGKTGEDDQSASIENAGDIACIKLFPNPTKGLVSISIETLNDLDYTIGIYDINGKLIRQLESGSTKKNKATVNYDASTLSKGIYLVKITTSTEQVITKKLVIE